VPVAICTVVVLLAALVGAGLRGSASVDIGTTSAAPTGPVASAKEPDIYQQTKSLRNCILSHDMTAVAATQEPIAGTEQVQIAQIGQTVEKIRKLRFRREPQERIVSNQSFQKQIAALDKGAADKGTKGESHALIALGAISPKADLGSISKRAAIHGILGFYSPLTKTLWVRSTGSRLGPEERDVIAHELEHADADQNLGLPTTGLSDDASSATRALIEGDARLTESKFAAVTMTAQQMRSAQESTSRKAAGLKMPYFLQRSAGFPYQEGELFVCRLFQIGGWKAVDRAYDSPPVTQAQVLFPDRYDLDQLPSLPPNPKTPEGWRVSTRSSFGAADLLWLFEAPGGHLVHSVVGYQNKVKRWNGGEVMTWHKKNSYATALSLVDGGSTDQNSPDLCHEVRTWFGKAFPDARRTSHQANLTMFKNGGKRNAIACTSWGVRFVSAPDASTATRLAAS
jgi:hypothetical protein